MRTKFVATVCLAGLSNLAAFAQQAPSLAIAGVKATPVLIEKYPAQTAPAAAVIPQEGADTGTIKGTWTGPKGKQSAPLDFTRVGPRAVAGINDNLSDLQGDWEGTMQWFKTRRRMVLHLTRLASGALSATLEDSGSPKGRRGVPARMVEFQPPTLRAHWAGEGSYEGIFKPSKTLAPSFTQGPRLEEVLHALDVQLADRLAAVHMFTVMDENDLKRIIAAPNGTPNDICNLKSPNIAEQYAREGINFLLVTELEEFSDQTIDWKTGSYVYATVTNQGNARFTDQTKGTRTDSGSASRSRGGSQYESGTEVNIQRDRKRSFSSSAQAQAGQSGLGTAKQQTVRLTVRCQLFDAAHNTRLESANSSFETNRVYVTVAASDHTKATSDFYQAAARNVANWAANRVVDLTFPMKVLEKNDGVITINRGEGSSLQVGQIFHLYAVGKELRDSATGEVLGHDEITVGRAAISELHPKFSKARVLDDTGIAVGAILRRP